MKMTEHTARSFFPILIILFMFSSPSALLAQLTGVQGISIVTGETRDVLTVRLPFAVQPEIKKLIQPARIVVELPGMTVAPSLLTLIESRSSVAVEKFEVHTLYQSARSAGEKAGVRYDISLPTVFIVAYVKPDVEAEVEPEQTTDQVLLNINYYRTQAFTQPEPVFPLPDNTLKNVSFTRDGGRETVELYFAYPQKPYTYETMNPRRLLLALSRTDLPTEMMSEFRYAMQLPRLFRFELFNIGSLPVPYAEMNAGREYQFIGFPSPFASDKFLENLFGFQKRGAVAAFYPADDVTYRIEQAGDDGKIILVFEKQPKEPVCVLYSEERSSISDSPPFSDPYPIEDEEGRLHKYSP
ncbi:MAG: hypothetical protein AB1546_02365 [bacterium]